MKTTTKLTATLVLLCAPAALAQGPAATSDQFQINTYTTDSQSGASVATAADGGFVVIWVSRGSSGSDTFQTSIQGQRYDAGGPAAGDQFQINTYTPYTQTDPRVATLSDGGFVVAWSSSGSSGTDGGNSIQGRLYDAGGVPGGDDFQVNTHTTGTQAHPSLAALTDGGFVVLWQSSLYPDSEGFSIQGQRYDAAGAPLGDELRVNLDTTVEQGFPSVAGLTDGGFVAVWTHVDAAGSSVRGRRYDAAGTPVGGELEIVNDFYPFFPAVTALAGGGFLVIWEDAGFYIDGRLYRADGTPAGGVFRITPDRSASFASPVAAARPDGGFVLAWHGRGFDPGAYGTSIQAQLFAADGSRIGGELRINSHTADRQLRPAVATAAVGEIVVAWESLGSTGSDASGYSIQGRRFVAPRFALNGLGGKCLDVENADPSDDTPVNLYRCNGGDNQRWQLELSSLPQPITGLEGKCLVPRVDASGDVRAVIGPCGDDRWQLGSPGHPGGGQTRHHAEPAVLIHTETGLCLDVEGGSAADGTPVVLFDCHGGANQLWRPATAVCTDDSLGLCLEGERFRADLTWRSFDGTTGSGRLVPVGSDDSGLLWFFEAENWEMLIKVLDGCGINNRFWVFAAATTTVEYTLTVTDTALGTIRDYFNPLGNAAAAITDTDAFATCSAAASSSALGSAAPPVEKTKPMRRMGSAPLPGGDSTASPASKGACLPSLTRMCLNNTRFSVEVEWRDYAGAVGSAQVVDAGSIGANDTSGMFWFFDSSNWGMLVKVLDACDLNGQFLFLGAATTDVEYTLTVTDTDTGVVWQVTNPLGNPSQALVHWFDTYS